MTGFAGSWPAHGVSARVDGDWGVDARVVRVLFVRTGV